MVETEFLGDPPPERRGGSWPGAPDGQRGGATTPLRMGMRAVAGAALDALLPPQCLTCEAEVGV
jgi:hypothetical protein